MKFTPHTHDAQRMNCNDFSDALSSTTMRSTVKLKSKNVWTTMKFGTRIHFPLRMKCNNLDFLAPQSGQIFNLPNTLVYYKIPAKQMTFLTRSAVLCVLAW